MYIGTPYFRIKKVLKIGRFTDYSLFNRYVDSI